MLICLLQLLVERIGGAPGTLRRAIYGPEQLLQVVDPFGILQQGLVFASLQQDLFDLRPGGVDQLQEPHRGVPIDEGLDAVVQVHEGLAILGEGELRKQVQGDSCRLPAEYALALGRLPVVTPEAADILEQHRPTEGVPLGDGGQVAPHQRAPAEAQSIPPDFWPTPPTGFCRRHPRRRCRAGRSTWPPTAAASPSRRSGF